MYTLYSPQGPTKSDQHGIRSFFMILVFGVYVRIRSQALEGLEGLLKFSIEN